jgi:putative ABC transport system permease protein
MSSVGLFRVLHLRNVARQPLRSALAAVAVAAGVTITVSSGLLVTSLERSVVDVLRQLGGPAPLRVVGPADRVGLDEGVADVVAAVEGVDAVVPVLHAVTIVERPDGHEATIIAMGVDCRVEALVGAFGCDEQTLRAPRTNAPVLMSTVLRRELGPRSVVRTNAGRVSLAGVAANDTLDETNNGRVAIFELRTAQKIFGRPDGLDAVYVKPETGVDIETLRTRIERKVGAWNTVLRSDELRPGDGLSGPVIPLLALASLLALGLGGLLVYNIVALTLAERRRDFAVASAVGATPRAITAGVLAEAAALGLAGGIGGALAGIALSPQLVRTISNVVVEQATGIAVHAHISWTVVASGIGLGAVAATLAAAVPAWRARRLDLAAELHGRGAVVEAGPRRVGVRLGVLALCAGGGLVLSFLAQRNGGLARWQPPLGGLALLATATSVFAIAGIAAPLVLRLGLVLWRGKGGPLRIAVANLVSQPRRTSVIAAAVAAAVALAYVLGATIPALRGSARRAMIASADGRVFVSNLPINNSANVDAKLSPDVLESLGALPGVARVDRTPYVGVGDTHGHIGFFADEHSNPVAYDVVAGEATREALERGEVILGTSAARTRGLRPGSIFRVPTPTGFADLRVAGIWATGNNNGFSAEISVRRLEELYGPQPSGDVLLAPAPGTTPEERARRVEAAKLDPDLYALTPDELAAQLADEVADQVTPFWALQRLVLFVALVGTLSTLLLVGVQRRREIGVLGAVGFGPGALGRMTLIEGVAAASAGALIGALGSVVVFEAIRNAAAVSIGSRPPFGADPLAAVVAAALALAVVAVGGALPAWRTSRLQIVEAIRDE